jgi:hypothetical protein
MAPAGWPVREAARPASPGPRALLAQAGALLFMAVALQLLPDWVEPADGLRLALLQGVMAALFAALLGMERWWIPIHLLFVPGLVWQHGPAIPAAVPLFALALLALVYGTVFLSRVPFYLSSRATAQALARLLPAGRPVQVIDLGCGLGGLLERLSRLRPAARCAGIELAPLPCLLAWLRLRWRSPNARVRWGSFWSLSLAPQDIVFAYLSPAVMERLWDKARREMRPGSLLVSNGFLVPGVAPSMTIPTGPGAQARLLVWRM